LPTDFTSAVGGSVDVEVGQTTDDLGNNVIGGVSTVGNSAVGDVGSSYGQGNQNTAGRSNGSRAVDVGCRWGCGAIVGAGNSQSTRG